MKLPTVSKHSFAYSCIIIFFLASVPQSIKASVVINEFLPAPSSGNSEWVEFYNSDQSVEDLSNYYFDDDTSFDSDSGSSGKVALSGLLSSTLTCNLDLSSFLNNNGDVPTIFKLDGGIIDSYQYASSSADKSYSRIPDGGTWQINQTPTKSSLKCSDLAPSPTPTPTLTPTFTPAPTPTNTPQPTATPTPTNTPTPTKTPTPTPKKTPTPTITLLVETTIAGEILGASETATPTPEEAVQSRPLLPFAISLLLISLGLGMLSLVLIWKKRGAY